MIVLCLLGDSGVGKTTIANFLTMCYDEFNIVDSYTTRPRRFDDEGGHIFIDDINEVDGEIVAFNSIGGYDYCATIEQFKEDSINIYIVDEKGAFDVIEYFSSPSDKVFCVKIVSDVRIGDEVRLNRELPDLGLDYDLICTNDNYDLICTNDNIVNTCSAIYYFIYYELYN